LKTSVTLFQPIPVGTAFNGPYWELAAPANRIFLVGDDDQTIGKSLPVSRS
jgi:hypothetical protein